MAGGGGGEALASDGLELATAEGFKRWGVSKGNFMALNMVVPYS